MGSNKVKMQKLDILEPHPTTISRITRNSVACVCLCAVLCLTLLKCTQAQIPATSTSYRSWSGSNSSALFTAADRLYVLTSGSLQSFDKTYLDAPFQAAVTNLQQPDAAVFNPNDGYVYLAMRQVRHIVYSETIILRF
jgi:hypothetical protein